jgi:predicted DNA binding CopG/RHH family protein
MKTLIPFIVTIAIGCASHAQPKFVKPVPPPPIEDDVVIVAQAPGPRALPAPAVAPVPPGEPGKPPRAATSLTWSGGGFKYGLSSSSSSSRRSIVIPKGEPSAELLADAEEDLNVMTVILEKALEQRSDDERKVVMGIDILNSSSGIRNVLIEGHGAIFTLKTKIALVPPPAPKKEEGKTKDTTSSEWEEAHRQLYGRSSDIEREINRALEKAHVSFGPEEEYNDQKLQRLKDSLVEALKSASNIRHLSGDQTVTVVVLSSSPVQEVRKIVADAGRGGGRGGSEVRLYGKGDRELSESRLGSRMMLQAKKSDIDSYAKGKLTTDAFREKVKIQIY